MKKNNQGFMLVEVIIASTVIVTAMIGIYTNFNKLYNGYQTRNSYHDIDGMYATEMMFDLLLEEGHFNKLVSNFFKNNTHVFLVDNENCLEYSHFCSVLDHTDHESYCSDIVDFYNINNMILVEYDKESVKNIPIDNQTFKEYIDYVINYYDIKTNEEYDYLLLTESCESPDTCYYSNMRVR